MDVPRKLQMNDGRGLIAREVDGEILRPSTMTTVGVGKTIRTQKRRQKRPRRLYTKAFSSNMVIVLAITMWCWFGTLVYSHYKLGLFEFDQLHHTRRGESSRGSRKLSLRDSTVQPEKGALTWHTAKPHKEAVTLVEPTINPKMEPLSLVEPSIKLEKEPRFLIFEADRLRGQGAGNLLNGLLATHLLGDEFERVVCIIPSYDFHMAFELINPTTRHLCKSFFGEHPTIEESISLGKQIALVNYKRPPDECKLQKILASEERAIFVQGNTYPRWRSVPPNYFFKFYRAKPKLLEILPYDVNNPPSTVVHLRLEDGPRDKRKGLDDESLEALGRLLKANGENPYLVTNNVPWFDLMERKFHWSHPTWQIVHHSAFYKVWGVPKVYVNGKLNDGHLKENKQMQQMQLWADWYTILLAKRVYHTYSDFSMSAIHWMGNMPNSNQDVIWSRIVLGFNPDTDELDLEEENWVKDPSMPLVVDRKGKELKNCHSTESIPAKKSEHETHANRSFYMNLTSKLNQNVTERSLDSSPETMK